MADFRELGLRAELLSALEDSDLERPTALQEAVIPAIRRGSNVVARASSGSGKTLAYTLGVLDRLRPVEPESEEGAKLRFIIISPTSEAADHIALAVFPYAQAAGLAITVAGGTWGATAREAEILVSPVTELMSAVRGSELKLDDVEAVVVDGASTIAELGDWEAVDAAMELLPRDAQRVVFTPAMTLPVQDLAERRVKRALSYPAESVIPEDRVSTGTLGYVLVADREKVNTVARQLRGPRGDGGPAPVIFCRSDERAADLAEALSIRGFVVGGVGDEEIDVAIASSEITRTELLEETDGEVGQTISFDVPADARTLVDRHTADVDAVVLAQPGEIAHLREIARQAGLSLRSIPLPQDSGPTAGRISGFRDEVRRALQTEDLEAQVLLLEPLFEEHGALEVAAALAAMLRRRGTSSSAQAAAETAPTPSRKGPEAGAPPATWSRLFVGVGSRDDVRPGDLVGALAGEANIPGSKIGKIEIRDSFSIVEVDASVSEAVVRAVNGTTLKGRSVRVDYDRGSDRGRRGGGAPPRRTDRKPPRDH
jgi:ATP-dependent RNA helicase DeaD